MTNKPERYQGWIGDPKGQILQQDTIATTGLARVDPKLLHPIQHRGGTAQADRALLRSRSILVECRTKLINHTRGIVKSMGGGLPSCASSDG